MDSKSLMELQASTLYVLNEQNRIVRINEQNAPEAPAVFLGHAKDTVLSYYHEKLPASVVAEISRYATLPLNIAAVLNAVSAYKPVKGIWIGPAFACVQPATDTVSSAVVINLHNRQLLEPYFEGLIPELEVRLPAAAYIVEGRAVSVCCCARKSGQAAEASLETAPLYRGKGYAQEAVIAWCQEVRRQGLLPLYSTSWDNLSSQRVAHKAGFTQFGSDFSVYVAD
ncbi:GNAT family N-acetyltransferase [Paenibacillus jiagnxiensis]|uniref:GNAT family N-acetyltransferase n=1 Tax=Paenibacillus jiagnxiensis TaxID=3228926 RepID=UPI0033B5E68E